MITVDQLKEIGVEFASATTMHAAAQIRLRRAREAWQRAIKRAPPFVIDEYYGLGEADEKRNSTLEAEVKQPEAPATADASGERP